MTWVIRGYESRDLDACLALINSNTPKYFANEESDEFADDLTRRDGLPESKRWPFFVLETQGNIRACGGFAIQNDGVATLVWGMVAANEHRQGLGTALLNYRLQLLRTRAVRVELDTTPQSFNFYQRFGFQAYKHIKDGYGPGLDKTLARFDISRA